MELIHEDTSEDRREVAAILQEEFGISAEQAPLDVRLQVRSPALPLLLHFDALRTHAVCMTTIMA